MKQGSRKPGAQCCGARGRLPGRLLESDEWLRQMRACHLLPLTALWCWANPREASPRGTVPRARALTSNRVFHVAGLLHNPGSQAPVVEIHSEASGTCRRSEDQAHSRVRSARQSLAERYRTRRKRHATGAAGSVQPGALVPGLRFSRCELQQGAQIAQCGRAASRDYQEI
jgi:hypothetical protein